MNIIQSVNGRKFRLNGVEYFKNFLSKVGGDKLMIYNAYNPGDVLVEFTEYTQFVVNGSTYDNAALLHNALVDILYTRGNVGDYEPINQNNKSKVFQIWLTGTGMATNSEVRSYINGTLGLNGTFNISEIDTPVIIEAYKNNTEGTIKWSFLYGGGKGNWSTLNQVASNQLRVIGFVNAVPAEVENLPNTVTTPLGDLPDANYLVAANAIARDLSDPDNVYLFTYTSEGNNYWLQFVGAPGIYGGGGNPQFTALNLLPSTNDQVTPTPIPTLTQVLLSGYQAINMEMGLFSGIGTNNWKYQEFFGGGIYHETGTGDLMIRYEQPSGWNIEYTIPYRPANDIFAFLGDVNGLSLQINQTTSDLSLVNSEGDTLATINIGYLSGINNTLAYNPATQSIDVTDPDGNILTSIPLGSFVTNVASSASFNGANPHVLEFKDSNNVVVYSVPITANNIQGLTAAITNVINTALIDATATAKGVIKLAGDLGGSAEAPKVVKLTQLADVDATEKVAVMVQPDGTMESEPLFESEVYDEISGTGYTSLASIVSQYPSIVGGELKRPQGFKVFCYFMTNPTIYTKCADNDLYWLKNDNTGVHKLL